MIHGNLLILFNLHKSKNVKKKHKFIKDKHNDHTNKIANKYEVVTVHKIYFWV